MSLRDLRTSHLRLICKYNIRFLLRSGAGIVFTLVAVFVGLTVAHVFLDSVEQLRKTVAEQRGIEISQADFVTDVVNEIGRPAAKWALGEGKDDDEDKKEAEEWAAFVVDENPALLSAIFLVILFSLPFLVTTGAFNQVSGDIQNKGLRYLLLRTERANIFFGRFIATFLFAVVVMAFLVTTIGLYTALKLDLYSFEEIFRLSTLALVGLIALSLPYVALCSWLSSSIASPFGSLIVSQLVVILIPAFAKIAALKWEAGSYIAFLIPWGIKFHFLHPDWQVRLLTVAACLGYTAVFLALGYRKFSRRDL